LKRCFSLQRDTKDEFFRYNFPQGLSNVAEPTRRETQLGLADLTKRLKNAGVPIAEQRIDEFRGRGHFLIGTPNRQADFELSTDFLDDLPNTTEYRNAVDEYARAIAGRMKFGSPEAVHSRSGIPVLVEVRWPIAPAQDGPACMLTRVTNLSTREVAMCAVSMIWAGGRHVNTIFDDLRRNANRVRYAVDDGEITFYKSEIHPSAYQVVRRLTEKRIPATQDEIQKFLCSNAYVMGFLAPDTPTKVWLLDPWDAEYLQVGMKDLGLAARLLKAQGLLDLDETAAYGSATDKLLQEMASPSPKETTLAQQRDLSLSTIPRVEVFNKEISGLLKESAQFAAVMIDLDRFKQLNDSKGHPEGNKCLDGTIKAIARVVGRKGRVFRWGGDEFAVILPDFTTEEAQVTAERIRVEIEDAKLGGDEIAVTASIGVCSTDHVDDKTLDGIVKCADAALYESKFRGRNNVSTWPVPQRQTTAKAM
jgi:diguanylate cyclase (GGDEF)-like protein